MISKKKRSSPRLRRIFRPKSEIQTLFQAESRHLLHNFGTQFPLEGGLFSIFHQKSASKAPKTFDFAYFTGKWGRLEPPPPRLPRGYATVNINGQINNESIEKTTKTPLIIDFTNALYLPLFLFIIVVFFMLRLPDSQIIWPRSEFVLASTESWLARPEPDQYQI